MPKETTLYYSMEKKKDENKQQCSKCKQYRYLDWFKPDRTQCNQCLETCVLSPMPGGVHLHCGEADVSWIGGKDSLG